MDDRDIQIGQRIRKFRKDKGLNQSELADKIGKSLRTVQKYEKGEIEVAVSVISACWNTSTKSQAVKQPCKTSTTWKNFATT